MSALRLEVVDSGAAQLAVSGGLRESLRALVEPYQRTERLVPLPGAVGLSRTA